MYKTKHTNLSGLHPLKMVASSQHSMKSSKHRTQAQEVYTVRAQQQAQ